MRIICGMKSPPFLSNTQNDPNRRVHAASDGASLFEVAHVAAAGDRFPPGDPRRHRLFHHRFLFASGVCRRFRR